MSRIKQALVESATRERPILLSGYWVRALLSGRKTQTRRVVMCDCSGNPEGFPCDSTVPKCPFGKLGDGLWVREAWRTAATFDRLNGIELGRLCSECPPLQYEADTRRRFWDEQEFPGRLRPSRFMPRYASRINLVITAVRVERLQDITAADALAEGIEGPRWRRAWIRGWDDVNALRGYPWKSNPYVWVVSFVLSSGRPL